MRRRTDLMVEILKSPVAQRIIDFVAPIYGESYTALWLYEVTGRALDDVVSSSDSLKTQTVPQTATWTLPHWEKEYGISPDPSWTVEQRRANIIAKMKFVAPVNPAKLAEFASAAVGAPCEVVENVSKNAFRIQINGFPQSLERLWAVVEEAKPAHLIWNLDARALDMESGLHMGGRAAAVVKLPIPALRQEYKFTSRLTAGMRIASIAVIPIPCLN